MAAMEQAANPMNRKTAPNMMSASWSRSIARSWSSNRPPPKHRQDTRLDVDVDAGRARGSDFTQTTPPMWLIMTGCGAVVLLLGWVSNTPWAHASTSRVAHLFDNHRHGCLRQNMHLDQRLRGCQPDTADANSGAARREDASSRNGSKRKQPRALHAPCG